MRWITVALPVLLAACGGAASVLEEVPPELRRTVTAVPPAPDRWPGPLDGLAQGQWARYRDGAQTITTAVAARDGDAWWIETIVEGDPRLVSARRVEPDGRVTAARYAEIGADGPSAVVDQPLAQAVELPAPRWTEVGRDVSRRRMKVGSRELDVTVERIRYEDVEGRRKEVVETWHPDVPPVIASGPHGGLVGREGARGTLALLDFGRDAKPLLSGR